MQIELGMNVIGYGERAPAPKAAAGCGYRYVILLLGCLANIVGYSDRSNLSLAIVPMAKSLSLDDEAIGYALGAFFMGYACTQVLGGFLAFVCGAKPVLLAAVALWSLATVLTPRMASTSLALLVAARVIIGLGEGLLLPCLHALASKMTSGQFMGTVVALLCGPLAEWWWPSLFFIFGGAGFVWCAAFALLGSSTPRESACVRAAELAHIESGTTDGVGAEADTCKLASSTAQSSSCTATASADRRPMAHARPSRSTWRAPRSRGGVVSACHAVPWCRLLLNRGTFAIFVAHATHNWGWYLLLSWLPKMLAEQGADMKAAGLLALVPHLAAFAMSNLGGAVADRILLPRYGLTRTRKLMQLAAQLGPCVAFSLFAMNPTPGVALTSALSTIAIACGALMQSGCWANILDVAPAHAGVLLGISNTIASLPGVLCNAAAGLFLQHGYGWRPIFVLSAAFELIGACTFAALATGEVQVR